MCEGCDGLLREVEAGRWDALLPPGGNSNHASFIEETDGRRMVMTWFAGSEEGMGGVAVNVATLDPQWADQGSIAGSAWSDASEVSERDGYSNQVNPPFSCFPVVRWQHVMFMVGCKGSDASGSVNWAEPCAPLRSLYRDSPPLPHPARANFARAWSNGQGDNCHTMAPHKHGQGRHMEFA